MKKEMIVELELREDTGKGAAKKLRKMGRIPAIVYGRGKESVSVSMDPQKLREILTSETGENTLFSMLIAGKKGKNTGMIKEFQKDPVTEEVIHADLITIDIMKSIEVEVPIHLEGTPVGVKEQGGILDFIVREVRVSCLPTDIPESIDLDVSQLSIGQHLSISDIQMKEEVKILDDLERTIAVVSPPKVEEVAVPVEAEEEAEAEEPEVVKKGKEEAEEKKEKAEEKETEKGKGRETEKDTKEKKEK
jgi:large subunit ribosomal protein L25